jgi:hypothetical protein
MKFLKESLLLNERGKSKHYNIPCLVNIHHKHLALCLGAQVRHLVMGKVGDKKDDICQGWVCVLLVSHSVIDDHNYLSQLQRLINE